MTGARKRRARRQDGHFEKPAPACHSRHDTHTAGCPMPTGHRLTARQIALIRRLYEEARWLTIEDIAGIAGIHRKTVLDHVRRGGWRRRGHRGVALHPRRHEAPALAATAAAPEVAASHAAGMADVAAAACPAPNPDRPLDRSALIAGLWRAVQLHVAELSGPAGGMTGEAGAGRSAQTLMTIARTAEKLMEMERADAAADLDAAGAGRPGGGAGPAGPGGGANDADAFRDALAARLEALLRERLARDDLRDDGDDLGADAPGDPAGDLPAAAGGDH